MANILEDLVEYCEAQSLGTAGTDLIPGRLPEKGTPATCTGFVLYGGAGPEHRLDGVRTPTQEFPRVQVRVRAATLAAAMTKAYAIWNKLAAVSNTTLNATRYRAIHVLQSPFELERDGEDRPIVAFNLEAEKAPS